MSPVLRFEDMEDGLGRRREEQELIDALMRHARSCSFLPSRYFSWASDGRKVAVLFSSWRFVDSVLAGL